MVKASSKKQKDEETAPSSSSEKKIAKIAKTRWNHIIRTTSKWLLIPIEVDEETGLLRSVSWKKWLIHYVIVMVYSAIMMYKLIVTLDRAFSQLDLITYMCACGFIVVFIPATAAVGVTILTEQFCALFNSWFSMLDDVEAKLGKRKTAFDDKAVSAGVISLVIAIYSAAINTACYSLVGEIPNCVLPTLVKSGLIHPSPTLPKMVWRLLCLPVEILTLLPPMLVVGVVAMMIILCLGMLDLYAGAARSIPIRNRRNWDEVYKMYGTTQVYNAVLMNWLGVVSVVLPFSACLGIILTLYVTIRPGEIPMIIYPCFPVVALSTMTVITEVLENARTAKSKADEVVGNLRMALHSLHIIHRFDPMERKICMRRLKSLRPVSIRIGEYAETTFEVTMNVWDEVFNQLLLLLSL